MYIHYPLYPYKNIRSIIMVRARQISEMPQPMYVKIFRRFISVSEIFCNANNHFVCISTT